MIALWSLAAIPIPLEKDISEDHATEIFSSSQPTHFIGEFGTLPPAFGTLKSVDGAMPSTLELARETLEQFEVESVGSGALAGLFYTSGTTGLPKGVMIRHDMLISNMYATQSRIQLRPMDRLFIAIPFRFISSISHFLVAILAGAVFVGTEKRLMPKNLIAELEHNEITAFGGAPIQLRFIAEAASKALKLLRWVMSSGDHLSTEIIESLTNHRPDIEVHTVYGLTEVAGRLCTLSPGLTQRALGSVGSAIPGMVVEVRNDSDEKCKPFEVGHVYAKGNCCFAGYIANEKATAKALTSCGFKTGDLGYLDDNGHLYLSGRSDSVFKRSGLKVSCLPIADALMATGFFSDATVLPREDKIFGAVPIAYVVMKDDLTFLQREVMKALRPLLPANHLPADFVKLDIIPRTGSGKVIRNALFQKLEEKAGQRT